MSKVTIHFKKTLTGLFTKRPAVVVFNDASVSTGEKFITVYCDDGTIYQYNCDEVARIKDEEVAHV